MSLHLITGRAGYEHVTAADHGAFNAALMLSGSYVLNAGNKFSAQVVTNNSIRISDGELIMQGRHVRLKPGETEEVTIANGQQDYKRNDLIVARYTKDKTSGAETVSFVVLQGTPNISNASDPAYTEGNILNGVLTADFPLYRVPLDGLNVGTLVPLFTVKDSFDERIKAVSADLANVVSGKTKVKKAASADSAAQATKATNDGNGNNIAETYATNQHVEEVLAGIETGETPTGNAAALGGETAEEWQKKLDKIRQSVGADLSVEGWYRLTVPKSNSYGSFILSFYNLYNHSATQAFTLMFEGNYQNGKFYLLGSKQGNTTNIDKIRFVKDEDGKFVVDVHYAKNGKNGCSFSLYHLIGGWNLADALTLVETEPAEDNVLTTYVIPSNAQPVLDTEVGTFIDEKTQSIKTTTSKSLTTKGWYRIASGARVASTTVITLTNPYNSMGADVTTLLYQCSFSGATYTNPQIILFGSMSANQKIFTDIRVVKTSDGIGVDVYYNQNVSNDCSFGLLNLYSQGLWRACDVVPIENTPEESEIVIQYNIPKNAQPVLNTELAETLANYLSLTGGGEVFGQVQFSNAHNLVTSINNTSDNPAYIAYHGTDGFLGALGFAAKNMPVFYESDYETPHHMFHDGNSTKIVFTESDTAVPADDSALWAHL